MGKIDLDVLFVCGYFEKQYEAEISKKTRTWMENAANIFQDRIIQGLNDRVNLSIVSAPFVGAWPNAYDDVIFTGFTGNPSTKVKYVHFTNIWGIRNLSRASSLKTVVRSFVSSSHAEKRAIVVYSAHTPFVEAGIYAKKLDPSIKVCIVVPDLPQYMNPQKSNRGIYDFFKSFDIARFNSLATRIDSFVILTKYMADALHIGNRPYEIIEGISDPNKEKHDHPRKKKFVYAGKLTESFGVKTMVEAFEAVPDPDAQLVICGGGELKEYVEGETEKDSRIRYDGVISAEMASTLIDEADVVINPRQNTEEYTKYSFPSKNIEYLQSGNTVIAYMLSGMPDVYSNFIVEPNGNSVQSLTEAMKAALCMSEQERDERYRSAVKYIHENLSYERVSERIIRLLI